MPRARSPAASSSAKARVIVATRAAPLTDRPIRRFSPGYKDYVHVFLTGRGGGGGASRPTTEPPYHRPILPQPPDHQLIPSRAPSAAVRVRINGELVLNPTVSQLEDRIDRSFGTRDRSDVEPRKIVLCP